MVYFSNLNYTKSESDARYAKLGAANVFAGQNTFNQRITSYRGFQTSNQNADILSMNSSNEKKARVVYKQETGAGFKNWCHMEYLWTNNDSTYTNLLTFTFKPDNSNDNNIVEFTTALGSFSFNNKEIKGVANPTTNTSVANKQYVDTAVSGLMKRKTIRLGDLQYREYQTVGNFKVFWFGGQYSNQTTNITKNRFVNVLFNNNHSTELGNRVNIALNFYNDEYKVGLFDTTTAHANNYWDDATITIIYI